MPLARSCLYRKFCLQESLWRAARLRMRACRILSEPRQLLQPPPRPDDATDDQIFYSASIRPIPFPRPSFFNGEINALKKKVCFAALEGTCFFFFFCFSFLAFSQTVPSYSLRAIHQFVTPTLFLAPPQSLISLSWS